MTTNEQQSCWICDESGLILSHILSYLKLEQIYKFSRVNHEWNEIISAGFFFVGNLFNLDEYLHEDIDYRFDDQELKTCFALLSPCIDIFVSVQEELVSRLGEWQLKKNVEKLDSLLKHMRKKHGTIDRIGILQMYETRLYSNQHYQEWITILSELFPNIYLIRMDGSGCSTQVQMDLFLNSFVKLKQLMPQFPFECSINFFKWVTKEFPNMEFLRCPHPAQSANEGAMFHYYGSDDSMYDYIRENPYVLNFVPSYSLLVISITRNYPKTLNYILEIRPQLLMIENPNTSTSLYGSVLKWAMNSNCENSGILDAIFDKITQISNKSDDYIKDIVKRPFMARNLAHPVSFHYGTRFYSDEISLVGRAERLSTKSNERLLKYLASKLVDKDIDSYYNLTNNFKFYSGNTPLQEMCLFTCPLAQFTLENYKNLEQEAFVLNNDDQNVLHFISFRKETTHTEQLCKYVKLTELVPSVKSLLFQKSKHLSIVPIELLTRSIHTAHQLQEKDFIHQIIRDMASIDEGKTIEICTNILKSFPSLSLFYMFSQALGRPLHNNYDHFYTWKVYPESGISIVKQYCYCFENGLSTLDINGRSLLFDLCSNTTNAPLIKLAVYYGCNVNEQDENQQTPLHICKDLRIRHLLWNIGADPTICDKWQKPAFPSKKRKLQVTLVMCRTCGKIFTEAKRLKMHQKDTHHTI